VVDAARGNGRLGDRKRGKQGIEGEKCPDYTGKMRVKSSLQAKISPLRGLGGESLEFCDTLISNYKTTHPRRAPARIASVRLVTPNLVYNDER